MMCFCTCFRSVNSRLGNFIRTSSVVNKSCLYLLLLFSVFSNPTDAKSLPIPSENKLELNSYKKYVLKDTKMPNTKKN